MVPLRDEKREETEKKVAKRLASTHIWKVGLRCAHELGREIPRSDWMSRDGFAEWETRGRSGVGVRADAWDVLSLTARG